MSDIKNLLTSIKDKLKDIGVFKTINIFNNQIERMKDGSGYSFLYPAVFLEVVKIENERLGLGINAYDIDIKIHLMDEMLDESNGELDLNLDVFDYRDTIISNLDMFRPFNTGNIIYQIGEQDFNHDNVYHYILRFKGKFIDNISSTYPIVGTGSYTISYGYEYNTFNGATGSTFSIPLNLNGGIGWWFIINNSNPTIYDFVVS